MLSFWCHYCRRAARGFDGVPLAPIPICRFRCSTPGHGTTSYLPPFLHRYLHYLVPVVEMVVEQISVAGAKLPELLEVDGPSAETAARWNQELTSLPVRERLVSRHPLQPPSRRGEQEPAYTWVVAQAVRGFFRLKLSVTQLLQRYRLTLMKRYFSAH